ncbi:response regulator receiver domain-containing protein [Prosthecobacter fusiformis]|uniref:histidine kinase n=1 Tax=Prosthecobacter fusiformis TaxID=48464 RepID=A0A4R7RIV8_9BACT|nr:response regulator [Prosthecobacter fusiformis]TDU64038.1 response regulator receiver domain-containing protein [Prosthecobacter fusiformis]
MNPPRPPSDSADDLVSQDPLHVNHRILIVDDNTTIHEDFRKILSPTDFGETDLNMVESAVFGDAQASKSMPDFELAFAAQGDGAVKLVEMGIQQGRPFALALVDVRMPPGMDGIATIKSLWRIQPDLQVAICTAYADYSWDDMVDHLGLSHRLMILKKPFDPIEVMQIANALTSKWAFERESALRQLGLQTKLWDSTKRAEDVYARLRQEHDDRVRLEQDIRKMQKMDALGGLAAGIAHDFNNVLTVIQGHLSMNLMTGDQPPGISDSMGEVLLAARRAADLTKQLLNFTSRDYKAARPMVLADEIESEVELLQRTLGSQVELEVTHAQDLPEVMADPGSLGQIVVNLAVNARDAMPKGGKLSISSRHVHLADEEAARDVHADARIGHFALLSVSDNGTGMPPEVVKQIFDPFFTTKEPGRGTGMGLAMVRGLARHMGGWVTVNSVVGVGTDFHIYLPIAGDGLETGTPPLFNHDFDGLLHDVSPCTLLIVDDDASVRHVMNYVLENQGHTVLAAKDAHEAWQMWRAHRHGISLVISDINLPGDASGFDLGRAILGDDATLPIIFTSGYCPDILGQTTSLQLGINYLPKPFDVLDLLNAVGQALTTGISRGLPVPKKQTAKLELPPQKV